MKKSIFLLSFVLVAFSFAANIVADVLMHNIELKVAEKEKEETGKQTDSESDLDKDKIHSAFNHLSGLLNSFSNQHLHDAEKIISSFLDTDINPPDTVLS